jgi:hypothetical protein
MATATFVKKSRKAIPKKVCGIDGGIPKGSSYYWWKFAYGAKCYSLTKPKRSALTRSSFYSTIYDLEDDVIANASADDSLGSTRDDVVSQLEDLKSECESSLENIPEQLREATAGSLLQERIDALDSAIQEFEGLELDEPSDDDLDLGEQEQEEDESDEDYEARKASERADAEREYWKGKLEEFQNVNIEAP